MGHMALPWTAIEDALYAWVSAVVPNTIWSYQSGPEPALPYATITIVGPKRIGRPAIQLITDLTAVGFEVQHNIIVQKELTVTVQVFGGAPSGAGGLARELADAVRDQLFLPSKILALNAVGLAVVNEGDTRELPTLLDTEWQSRALFETRFRIADVSVEGTGYIDTAPVAPKL